MTNSPFTRCQTTDEVMILLAHLTDEEGARYQQALDALVNAAQDRIRAITDREFDAATGSETVQ